MKKIFALLSLIAMLTVVFTSQTLANDHKVVMGIQMKFNVAVDTVNYTAHGVEDVDKPDIVSRDLYNISDTKFDRKDLPFEVGWTNEKLTIFKLGNDFGRKDLPFEVGWTK